MESGTRYQQTDILQQWTPLQRYWSPLPPSTSSSIRYYRPASPQALYPPFLIYTYVPNLVPPEKSSDMAVNAFSRCLAQLDAALHPNDIATTLREHIRQSPTAELRNAFDRLQQLLVRYRNHTAHHLDRPTTSTIPSTVINLEETLATNKRKANIHKILDILDAELLSRQPTTGTLHRNTAGQPRKKLPPAGIRKSQPSSPRRQLTPLVEPYNITAEPRFVEIGIGHGLAPQKCGSCVDCLNLKSRWPCSSPIWQYDLKPNTMFSQRRLSPPVLASPQLQSQTVRKPSNCKGCVSASQPKLQTKVNSHSTRLVSTTPTPPPLAPPSLPTTPTGFSLHNPAEQEYCDLPTSPTSDGFEEDVDDIMSMYSSATAEMFS
ncbi:hypothetical protein BKA62DRAFT_771215 [Auriculariales sp. MPI-PUGE-AT-0066]|nr:hypothetical protein BKA62DRAFT_771215 [Auriculariales sp. MPI-PUGE-AT-0066]